MALQGGYMQANICNYHSYTSEETSLVFQRDSEFQGGRTKTQKYIANTNNKSTESQHFNCKEIKKSTSTSRENRLKTEINHVNANCRKETNKFVLKESSHIFKRPLNNLPEPKIQ